MGDRDLGWPRRREENTCVLVLSFRKAICEMAFLAPEKDYGIFPKYMISSGCPFSEFRGRKKKQANLLVFYCILLE